MARLEGDLADRARRTHRRALWQAAGRYRRSHPWLEDLLPPPLLARALEDGADPAVTWQVLRHLCRHLRFNARSALGSPPRLARCRLMAAGEVLLLSRQRAALHDRRFVGEVLGGLRRAL